MDCQHPRAALAQAGFPLCLNDFCPGTQSPREKKKKTKQKNHQKPGAGHQIYQIQARGRWCFAGPIPAKGLHICTCVAGWRDRRVQERHNTA